MQSEALALAERAEQASGADRELDAAIKEAIGAAWDYAADWGPRGHDQPVAYAYTASLDAAMMLVPKGWRIYTGDFSVEGRFKWMLCGPKQRWVTLEDGSREAGDDWYKSGVAATPALALCVAALKARAAIAALDAARDVGGVR